MLPGEQIRSVAVCIPASTPSVVLTQTPKKLSKDRTPLVSWTSSDQAGETLSAKCRVDGQQYECPTAGSFGLGPLADGVHSFEVTVTNQSGRTASAYYEWLVDGTAPVVTGHTPASTIGVAAPLTIMFSEKIAGAAEAVQVHGEETNADVPGRVTRPSPTTLLWTPSRPLVPGEMYRVSLTDAIHDVAGNALIPTFFDVRAATVVQNSSPALAQAWDVDERPVASDATTIASRARGSAAFLSFTTTAGQTVSVFGIRLPGGGFADVYLDGVKRATPSFYGSTVARSRLYLSPALTAGAHTLSVRPLNTKPASSSGTWVALDNLVVGSAVRQESALRQTFLRVTAANASGGSYDVATHVTDSDAAPAFSTRFVGDGVKVFATKTPMSGRARIFVDGVLRKTVDLHAASATFKALVFSATLAPGVHRIRVEPVGTANGSGSAVGIDYFQVM